MDQRVFIGELAGRLGVTAKALRHYESLGLLAPPTRTEAGYRLYDADDEERLRFILGAKALGLSLDDIGEIMAVWSHGERPCSHVSDLLDDKLAALDRRIAELTTFRDALRAYKDRVDASPADDEIPCKHIEGVGQGLWPLPLGEADLTKGGAPLAGR